jgi:hypothetical protein
MCWGLVRENDKSWKVILLIIEVVSLIGLFVKGSFQDLENVEVVKCMDREE